MFMMIPLLPLFPLFPFPLTWNPPCCDGIRPPLHWVARKLTLAFPPSCPSGPSPTQNLDPPGFARPRIDIHQDDIANPTHMLAYSTVPTLSIALSYYTSSWSWFCVNNINKSMEKPPMHGSHLPTVSFGCQVVRSVLVRYRIPQKVAQQRIYTVSMTRVTSGDHNRVFWFGHCSARSCGSMGWSRFSLVYLT